VVHPVGADLVDAIGVLTIATTTSLACTTGMNPVVKVVEPVVEKP
jgi:hypothetical protein